MKPISSCAVIGISALGMPTMSLLLRMFHLEQIVLVDHDKWESGQLNKHIFSAITDVGENKVLVARSLIRRYSPRIVVTSLRKKFQDAGVKKILQSVDLLVSCVDNDETRLDVQLFAVDNRKIMLDISAEVIRNEKVATSRIYIPNKTPCILCQGLDFIPESLFELRTRAGYFNNSEERPGSVAVLDTCISSIGLSLLSEYLDEKKNLPTTISLNLSRFEINKLFFHRKQTCNICRPHEEGSENATN